MNTQVNQKIMAQSGILLPIVQLGICSNAPSIVRTEALYAIAYVVRGNTDVQDMFAKIVVASPPRLVQGEIDPTAPPGLPRPAMVSLIAVAVAADPTIDYSYASRAAATFAVFSCLQGNKDAQVVLTAMLKMPPEDNVNTDFPGKWNQRGALTPVQTFLTLGSRSTIFGGIVAARMYSELGAFRFWPIQSLVCMRYFVPCHYG